MPARKIMTLYPPMAREVADRLMQPAREMMEQFGFKWWVTYERPGPGITLMIQSPEEWIERGPTTRELERFFELYEAGHVEEARRFAATGFPPALR